MRSRPLIAPLIVLLALSATLPPSSALHNGSHTRTETGCVGTVCVTLSVTINADNCAFLAIGTPCEVLIYGSVRGQSVLGGHASGQITGYSTASCGWGAASSCTAFFPDSPRASFRGEIVCVSASAFAQDTLFVAPVSFTHCYEAH